MIGWVCTVVCLLVIGVGGWVMWWMLQRPLPTDMCLCGCEYQQHRLIPMMGEPCTNCSDCGLFRPVPRPLPPNRYHNGY